ncbi:MAG TPA: IclR family transcriptional regulator [Eoetvoesiella sp.]
MPRKAQIKSIAEADAAPGGVAAVDRALSLLAAFRHGDKALGLAELAQRTRMYKSTVLRLLASLEHGGLVQRIDGGPQHGSWTLGSEIARLNGVYAASFSLENVVVPVLRELVSVTGESAAFHVRQGKARLCLYRVDSPHPIRDHIKAGDLLDPEHGSGARVLIAFGEDPGSELVKKDKKLYEQIRTQGYCANAGDRIAEVAGISAPVFKADGTLAGAMTLTLPVSRYDTRHIEPVLKAAQRLSGQI